MKTIYWWHEMGDFLPDEDKNYPDPLQVVSAYFLESGLSLHGLGRELGLGKNGAKYLLSYRVALDSIARRRDFVRLLHIPPQLLRLDCLHQPTFEPPFWWVEEGYPAFLVGPDGYPLVGNVVKCLRRELKKVSPKGKEKFWTQVDLAEALGISEIVIRRLENDNQGSDSISRRTILSQILLGGASALFGLDSLTHPAPYIQVPAIHVPKAMKLDAAMLAQQRVDQAHLYEDYYTHHGQDAIGIVMKRLRSLHKELLPIAHNDAQRFEVVTFQCNYHKLIVGIAREKQDSALAMSHANRAVALAADTHERELIADTLLRRVEAFRDLSGQDGLVEAKKDIDGALSTLFPKEDEADLQSDEVDPSLKARVLEEAGFLYARLAQDEGDRSASTTWFAQAETVLDLVKPGNDPHFLKADKGFYSIVRARTLLDPRSLERDGKQRRLLATQAINYLDDAQRLTSPALTRRRAYIDVYRAEALFLKGEYEAATQLALDALEACKQIKAQLIRDRIEALYHQLSSDQCSYRGSPLVARLGWKLQSWR